MSGPRTHDKNDLVVIAGAGGSSAAIWYPSWFARGHSRVRVSGDAGGRVRLGEAIQRAHVPALLRRLRTEDEKSHAMTMYTVLRARSRGRP